MLNVWTSVCSKSRRNRTVDYWHSLLTDPRSAFLPYHFDDNVVALQQKLQGLKREKGLYTFFFSSFSFPFPITGICLVKDNEILFSYIRAVLEIFVLYFIETSDLN